MNDNSAMSDRPHQQAELDWERRRVKLVGVGLLDSEHPLLYEGDLFYSASLGCQLLPEKFAWADAYNEAIDRLVARHGVPDWCPRMRLPSVEFCADSIRRDGQAIELYAPTGLYEARASRVATQRPLSKWRPSIWCYVQDRELVLFAGPTSFDTTRLDVVDLVEFHWMASLRVPRLKIPD